MAEKADGSNGAIVPFATSDDPRRASETCWHLEVGSLTNPPGSVISSPKTKDSVIPQAEWSWSEDSANISQGRTGHYPIFKSDVLDFNSSSTSHFTKCIS